MNDILTPWCVSNYRSFPIISCYSGARRRVIGSVLLLSLVFIACQFGLAQAAEASGEFGLSNGEWVITVRVMNVATGGTSGVAIIPLAYTPEMQSWAKQLVSGSPNEISKAKALSDALCKHVDDLIVYQPGTAQDVFNAWSLPGASFHCQEYAFLYVALARAVGLDAYHVLVFQLWDGKRVFHACAGVFIDGRVLLVDPSHRWFGVPHQRFLILNDLQSVAIATSSIPKGNDALKTAKIAGKLAPDLALVQLALFDALVDENKWTEARKLLPVIAELNPEEDMVNYAQAQVALHDARLAETIKLANRAIEINSGEAQFHLLLAQAYVRQSHLKEAKEAFQRALECPLKTKALNEIKQAINEVDLAIEAKKTSAP